jgi:excinuclease ABC subunit C
VPGNEGVPFVEMVGLAKSRLLDHGTARVVPGRRRRGSWPPAPDAAAQRASPASDLADAAEAAQRGFVAELERTPERVFLQNRKDPVVLRQNSAELFLVTRLRDEAHRFAITFHRKLRRSRNFQSVLEEIPGVGPGRRKALLRALGSLKRIREASLEEISCVEGCGPAAAKAVWDFFHPATGAPPAGIAAEATPLPNAGAGVTEAEIDQALAEEEASS